MATLDTSEDGGGDLGFLDVPAKNEPHRGPFGLCPRGNAGRDLRTFGTDELGKALRNAVGIGLVVGGVIVAVFAGWRHAGTASTAVASADVIAQGRQIYADHCAACHGADLEGQPDWRTPFASGRLPAPPHDESGHTWHHPDAVLFRIVNEGTAAVVGGGYESDMLGFADVLSDAEIRAVLDFIKSTWPARERSYQLEISRSG